MLEYLTYGILEVGNALLILFMIYSFFIMDTRLEKWLMSHFNREVNQMKTELEISRELINEQKAMIKLLQEQIALKDKINGYNNEIIDKLSVTIEELKKALGLNQGTIQ